MLETILISVVCGGAIWLLSGTQASTSVQHLVLPCHWSQRNAMVPDLVRCYGACGRTIVFTETKRDANDLVTALGDSVRALHGDIPQVRVPPPLRSMTLSDVVLSAC